MPWHVNYLGGSSSKQGHAWGLGPWRLLSLKLWDGEGRMLNHCHASSSFLVCSCLSGASMKVCHSANPLFMLRPLQARPAFPYLWPSFSAFSSTCLVRVAPPLSHHSPSVEWRLLSPLPALCMTALALRTLLCQPLHRLLFVLLVIMW